MPHVRYFAAAAEAAGTSAENVNAATLGDLLATMKKAHGPQLVGVLQRCSVLINGATTSDPAAAVPKDATVDVLPPFAGG